MTPREWADGQSLADVAEAKWRAAELGEPYNTVPKVKAAHAAAFCCFLLALAAIVLAVVVVQVARHWFLLGHVVVVVYVAYVLADLLDRGIARVVGWFR